MHYVMSDLHGTYTEFMKMLDLIDFNKEKDKLFILGDIVDRGRQVDKCIRWIIDNLDNKSVYMTLGNHEWQWKEYLEEIAFELGLDITNGEDIKELRRHAGCLKGIKKLKIDEIQRFYSIVKELPLYYDIEVDKKKYILVHAGINIENIKETKMMQATWAREEFYNGNGLNGYTIIFGHTPVIIMEDCGRYYRKSEHSASIHYREDESMVDIDCGAVFWREGRLACLRLEDKKEYYVQGVYEND